MWKLHHYWLTLIGLDGTMHVTKEEKDPPLSPEGEKDSRLLPRE